MILFCYFVVLLILWYTVCCLNVYFVFRCSCLWSLDSLQVFLVAMIGEMLTAAFIIYTQSRYVAQVFIVSYISSSYFLFNSFVQASDLRTREVYDLFHAFLPYNLMVLYIFSILLKHTAPAGGFSLTFNCVCYYFFWA